MMTILPSSGHGEAYADEGDSAEEPTPSTISMTVSGDRNGVVETGVGVTAYRSHEVEVTVTDVLEYYLKISGSSELAPPTGGEAVPSVTTATIGSEMPEDSWGYAWDWDGASAQSDAEMTYVGMPSTATALDKPALVNGDANFTGKLSFAAKFKKNAVVGNYGSGVTLTLIATPRANTESNKAFWYNDEGVLTATYSDTNIMQNVAPDFCRRNDLIGVGWTITLTDDRDGKEYKIVKLKDGNCWMQENLALEYDTAHPEKNVLSSEDSDLPAGVTWELPESTTEWDKTDNTKAQVAVGSNSLEGWEEGYGNYYSWIAATAGTGNNATANGAVATGSICPKGWTLPTGGSGGGQFRNLFGAGGNDLGSSAWTRFDTARTAPYSFGVAGHYDGSLNSADSVGLYWSRTSYSDTYAYYLGFDSGNFNSGTSNGDRYNGFPVRCVQSAEAIWNNNGINGLKTDLRSMQDITKANFTEKYCKNSTAANALVPLESTLNLLDNRDGKYYTVVKLNDGNCWMQENLALSGPITLTSADSDASSFTLPADTVSWGSNNSVTYVKTGSTSLSGWQQGYGNYYSWQAATAETGNSATGNGTNASSSICPKGWKLPTGKNSADPANQFLVLLGDNGANIGASNAATALTKIQDLPYKFLVAGGYSSGSLGSAGSRGYYWSRTSLSSTAAYNLFFYASDFYPGTYNSDRHFGYSVRCIAEPEG